MKLIKLYAEGFKAFADPTTVYFDNGVTGVVGPNGCGKSNIVDAISKFHRGVVNVVEPNIVELPNNLKNCYLVSSIDALKTSDINVLLVDHKEFRNMDLSAFDFIDTKGIVKN